MAQTFWTGSSLSFTNGSKIVTVNTGPSVDSIYPNSKLKAGNYNEPVEVKAAYGSTIELYNNWPGSTGNTSATITPSAAAAAAAGTAAQQVITEIQNLVGSASATATANSFVKRDTSGRIKAASPSANDDVVTKGYFQSDTALNEAGVYHSGNSVNPLDYGLGSDSILLSDPNTAPRGSFGQSGSLTHANAVALGYPDLGIADSTLVWWNVQTFGNANRQTQIATQVFSGPNREQGTVFSRVRHDSTWTPWALNYSSGNTNFNEFGGTAANDVIATGYSVSTTVARFFLPINSPSAPTSITTTGTFEVLRGSGSISTGNSAVTLSGRSSNKIAVIEVSSLNSLTAGEMLELRHDSANGKITVNF